MAAMSDYLEQQILNDIFRTTARTRVAALWVALFTAAPSDSGGGTECTGGSYARTQVTQADASWSAPGVGGITDNAAAITFPTATGGWGGTITHVGIFDASTSGNLLFHGILAASKGPMTNGDVFKFNIGDLDITLA
jgi:hypothetical protein